MPANKNEISLWIHIQYERIHKKHFDLWQQLDGENGAGQLTILTGLTDMKRSHL